MKPVVILGAGGHGREVAEILRGRSQGDNQKEILGFVDDNPKLRGQTVNGLRVLGDWSWFHEVNCDEISVICAVGKPEISRQLVKRAVSLGLTFVNAISPLAHISSSARLDRGITIFPNVVVSTNVHLESHCILNVGVTISHDTKIGGYCNINPGAHIAGNVVVKEGCYIGMGVNVIQNVSIGSWTTVGAGAVIIQDMSSNVTAVGIPAKVIKKKSEGWYEEQAGLIRK